LGALYLGKRAAGAGFADRLVADLRVLTTLAVPFLAQLRRVRAPAAADTLLGESPAMNDVRRLIERVAPSDLSVLVVGATGTGKELVARAIHEASSRRARPLVALNCASVPESLLGAELFGYRKGAFTGAIADREGLVEAAEGSTLFLDEVGDMPSSMQAALLRVLEQREVRRIGETHARSVDFRLIAATHRDLPAEVAAGHFREDLRYRLAELTVELPRLADRGEDVDLLARFFLRQAETQLALPMHTLGPNAEAVLRRHPWPGNVRELRATLRRAAVLADDRVITAADLRLEGSAATPPGSPADAELGDLSRPLAAARDQFVNRYAAAVLARCGGDREATAKSLEIGVRTLYRYLSA
jgi:DNA-binding NtrC family response regulator